MQIEPLSRAHRHVVFARNTLFYAADVPLEDAEMIQLKAEEVTDLLAGYDPIITNYVYASGPRRGGVFFEWAPEIGLEEASFLAKTRAAAEVVGATEVVTVRDRSFAASRVANGGLPCEIEILVERPAGVSQAYLDISPLQDASGYLVSGAATVMFTPRASYSPEQIARGAFLPPRRWDPLSRVRAKRLLEAAPVPSFYK
ncbi:MAG: hypothetical protein JHD15_17120 [Phenylobacterium sp.]|uniref:hypothetical protein n=1 Tax=Phenylobacterium sp. TaxID=1871053 RepID=UPI001A3204E7|nr:hypothetical protein [Phenylobacterium sp.]MBJ7412068.1 hypothetical protein [Phenylobacterium sp.]